MTAVPTLFRTEEVLVLEMCVAALHDLWIRGEVSLTKVEVDIIKIAYTDMVGFMLPVDQVRVARVISKYFGGKDGLACRLADLIYPYHQQLPDLPPEAEFKRQDLPNTYEIMRDRKVGPNHALRFGQLGQRRSVEVVFPRTDLYSINAIRRIKWSHRRYDLVHKVWRVRFPLSPVSRSVLCHLADRQYEVDDLLVPHLEGDIVPYESIPISAEEAGRYVSHGSEYFILRFPYDRAIHERLKEANKLQRLGAYFQDIPFRHWLVPQTTTGVRFVSGLVFEQGFYLEPLTAELFIELRKGLLQDYDVRIDHLNVCQSG